MGDGRVFRVLGVGRQGHVWSSQGDVEGAVGFLDAVAGGWQRYRLIGVGVERVYDMRSACMDALTQRSWGLELEGDVWRGLLVLGKQGGVGRVFAERHGEVDGARLESVLWGGVRELEWSRISAGCHGGDGVLGWDWWSRSAAPRGGSGSWMKACPGVCEAREGGIWSCWGEWWREHSESYARWGQL